MKRVFYIMCIGCVSALIVYAWKLNLESMAIRYIPAERILSEVQKENRGEADRKVAYLTFDDGPSEVTPSVLDILKEKGVKATFFLVGNEITDARKAIVDREKAEGHAIGIHTNTHKKCDLYSSYESFLKDFTAVRDKIEQITGERVSLHRYPWGSNNGFLKSFYKNASKGLEEQGVRSFDWNVSAEDSFNNGISCSRIISNVKKDYKKFSQPIILLHDSNTTKNTALALRDMIDMLKKDGYDFDTLENRKEYIFPDSWR